MPPALALGQEVGIIAPSSPLAAHLPRRFLRGKRELERQLGVRARCAPHLSTRGGLVSAPGDVRARELVDLLRRPEVGGVFTSLGGFHSAEMLPHLNRAAFSAGAKVLVGYSDTTALLLGVYALAGWETYYGPAVMTQFAEYPRPHAYTMASLRGQIGRRDGEWAELRPPRYWTQEHLDWSGEAWHQRPRRWQGRGCLSVWHPGEGAGRLFGGHLETVCSLAGTPYFRPPNPAIFFWEACGEDASAERVRRALQHLDQTGLFAGTRAMLIGRCPQLPSRGPEAASSIVGELARRYGFPAVAGLPFGHTDPMATLPIGAEATVEAGRCGGDVRVRIYRDAAS